MYHVDTTSHGRDQNTYHQLFIEPVCATGRLALSFYSVQALFSHTLEDRYFTDI